MTEHSTYTAAAFAEKLPARRTEYMLLVRSETACLTEGSDQERIEVAYNWVGPLQRTGITRSMASIAKRGDKVVGGRIVTLDLANVVDADTLEEFEHKLQGDAKQQELQRLLDEKRALETRIAELDTP